MSRADVPVHRFDFLFLKLWKGDHRQAQQTYNNTTQYEQTSGDT